MSATVKAEKFVELDITPADFSEADLAQHLRDRGYRVFAKDEDVLDDFKTDDLVEELESRGKVVSDEGDEFAGNADLDEAGVRFRHGEIADAFFYLERAFPKDFAGLAQLAPENRP